MIHVQSERVAQGPTWTPISCAMSGNAQHVRILQKPNVTSCAWSHVRLSVDQHRLHHASLLLDINQALGCVEEMLNTVTAGLQTLRETRASLSCRAGVHSREGPSFVLSDLLHACCTGTFLHDIRPALQKTLTLGRVRKWIVTQEGQYTQLLQYLQAQMLPVLERLVVWLTELHGATAWDAFSSQNSRHAKASGLEPGVTNRAAALLQALGGLEDVLRQEHGTFEEFAAWLLRMSASIEEPAEDEADAEHNLFKQVPMPTLPLMLEYMQALLGVESDASIPSNPFDESLRHLGSHCKRLWLVWA
jgi:hypothetical protein